MNRKRIFTGAWILLIITVGCHHNSRCIVAPPVGSQVPVPSAYHLSTQPVMQSVHHWELLAEDVAETVSHRLASRESDTAEAIYIVPFGSTPFEKAFRELLITKLVEKMVIITDDPKNPMMLNAEIQLIRHDRNPIRTPMGVYKSLAPGLFVRREIPLTGPENRLHETENNILSAQLNVEAGMFTPYLPETEILITTSLSQSENDRYILRNSSIYYISDNEWWHYRKRSAGVLKRESDVTYTIVSD